MWISSKANNHMAGWVIRRALAAEALLLRWLDRRLGVSPTTTKPSSESVSTTEAPPELYATPAALQNAEQRADRGTVLAAVQQHAGHLRHASKELRADREVVMAAVTKGGSAIRYASAALHSQSVSLSGTTTLLAEGTWPIR